jgi:fermentation-respiration switch protein FrsA (DUF1100 family)
MSRAVTLQSEDVEIAGDLWIPDGTEAGPAVVIGHGTAMVKEALVAPAEYLCRAGFAVLAIDYRGFGLSAGEPRGGVFPRRHVEDFRSAISWLGKQDGVDPERIGIWAPNGIVIQVAAVDRRVKAVVAQSPIVDGRRWVRELRSGFVWEELLDALQADRERRDAGEPGARVPLASPTGEICIVPVQLPEGFVPDPDDTNPVRNPFRLKTWAPDVLLESIEQIIDFNPTDVIDRIAPRPLLIVANSGRDEVHFLDHIQDAFKKAGEPKELRLFDYGSFGLYEGEGQELAMNAASVFFGKYL